MIRKLLKSLLKPSAYPEPTESVRFTETHVSFIFVCDSYVYKVKKSVDLGFLNFTSLDRRRFYCNEEVRLNSRLCADLYLGVVELRETAGGCAFGGDGKVIDYAVKMKRLPEDRMLDQLLKKGELTPAHLAELGRFVAEFHRRAERGPQIDAYGSLDSLKTNWEENFRQAAPFAGRTLAAADLFLLRDWVSRFLSEKGDLLEARVREGFIRECDGDLHLGNICLNDRPSPRLRPVNQEAPGLGAESGICIFDCIEFSERLRCIDTAADIAFLLMDLEFSGRPDLCLPFLDAYREKTGDLGMEGVLDFYKASRAFVRGKVKSLRLLESGVAADELRGAETEAMRYFRLARGYCLRERLSPTLIVTCGLMGSGKSALARQLSRELGLTLLSSDPLRKSLAARAQTPPSSKKAALPKPSSPDDYDRGIYTADMNRAVYALLRESARDELKAGRSVVVDATFRRAADREEFRALSEELGVPFVVVRVDCPVELIRERLEQRKNDPNEVSDGRWEIFPRQLAEFQTPVPGEAIAVDSSLPLDQEVDLVLKRMGILA